MCNGSVADVYSRAQIGGGGVQRLEGVVAHTRLMHKRDGVHKILRHACTCFLEKKGGEELDTAKCVCVCVCVCCVCARVVCCVCCVCCVCMSCVVCVVCVCVVLCVLCVYELCMLCKLQKRIRNVITVESSILCELMIITA